MKTAAKIDNIQQRAKWCLVAAWLLAAAVCAVAFVAWGQSYQWQLSNLTAYQVFPLLGLLAFSLMWTHYVLAWLRDGLKVAKPPMAGYFRLTGYAVLVLICLHPGLLIYARFRDGYGLPPNSYETYVAPGLRWITLLGTASLLVFLAFELHRFFGKQSWWPFVRDASDLAMLAIFYHALRLGTQLQSGWYRYVWWLYGISLAITLLRKYGLRLANQTNQKVRA